MFFDPYKYNIDNVEGLSIALGEKQLKTLASAITIDGHSYTQVESTLNAIKSALDDRQKEDLSSSVTIGGVPQTTVEGAIGGLNDVKADLSDIADPFDPTESYDEGDYVTYNGSLYKCTYAHTGAWNSAHFTMTLVADEFGSGGSADITSIAPAFSDRTPYAVGAYVTYEGKFYKCTTTHSAGAWNSSDFTETTVDAEYMAKGRDYVTAGKKSGTTLGTKATAEGYDTTASGSYSHAEGSDTTASGLKSHAEGNTTTASNQSAHAEGFYTTASGIYSHSEGNHTTASGEGGHAEGNYTTASSDYAHAEGNRAEANHNASHAEGLYTKTGNSFQHVQGKYNEGKSTTAFEIGNGTGTSAADRSNAFEVEWDGDVMTAGEITDGGGNVLSDKFDATSYVNRFERYTISSSNWSANPDSNGYYTNTITTSAYNSYAGFEVSCTGSADGTTATSAQEAAYALVDEVTMPDGTGATSLTLYAKTKPTTTFYIRLKGTYMAKNAASSTKALDITTGCTLTITDKSDYSASQHPVTFNGSTARTLEFVNEDVYFNKNNWSATVNAGGYYTNTVTGLNPINTYKRPHAGLVPPNGLTITAAMSAAYNLVDYFDMDDGTDVTSVTAYAKTKPTESFHILIDGIHYA